MPVLFFFLLLFIVSSGSLIRSLAESIKKRFGLNCTSYDLIVKGFGFNAKRGTVCCKTLGCFSNEVDKGSGKSATNSWTQFPRKPMCADEINPEFYLYSKDSSKTTTKECIIEYSSLNSSIQKCTWKNFHEVFLLIHGWKTDWPVEWMNQMKDALLKNDKKVILVRWSNGSNVDDYGQGASNTRVVGAAIAYFIKAMISFGRLDLSSLTLVGFSLGAHVAGFAAKMLPGLTRLIGLDPAGPLFACQDPAARIDVTDAKLVQIFHTNGNNPLTSGRGTMQQLGHLDYYVSGGREQPDCDNGSIPRSLQDVFSIKFSALWSSMSCSHQRAPAIYTELIKAHGDLKDHCQFLAISCNKTEKWYHGDCFDCSNNSSCLMPNYAPSVNSAIQGKFYFNVRYDGAKIGEFCGRQISLQVTSNKEVTGDLKVRFENEVGEKSDNIPLMRNGDTLYKNKPFSRILTLPWLLGTNIKSIDLNYTHSKGLINRLLYRNHEFVIVKIVMTDISGRRLMSCADSEMESNKPVKTFLKSHC